MKCSFSVGDLVRHKKSIETFDQDIKYKNYYHDMRVIQIFHHKPQSNMVLCEWYNKKWEEWTTTVFDQQELVKKHHG